MVDDGVESEIVTVFDVLYVPAAGLKVGVAAAGIAMVYNALPTNELVYPPAAAMALTVWVVLTEIGPLYTVEPVVGVLPLVV